MSAATSANGAFILFHLAPDGRLLAASGIGRGNAVARDIRLAEMLIAKRARPDPVALALAGRQAEVAAGGRVTYSFSSDFTGEAV